MAVPILRQTTVLSYHLYTTAANSKTVLLGQVLNATINESRDVTPNFTIGSDPADEADALIPGVVRTRTIRLRRVRLFAKGLKQAFGRDDQTVVASLGDQNTPIDLVATILDPNTNKTKTLTFKDGFLSDYTSNLDLQGDIREIEECTYTYRAVRESQYQ
jgi:hypothetical protein